jgi:hypothetical protein
MSTASSTLRNPSAVPVRPPLAGGIVDTMPFGCRWTGCGAGIQRPDGTIRLTLTAPYQ